MMFSDNGKPVILITAITKWVEPPRMRHYVATYLSPYYNIIFCELNQKGRTKLYFVNESILVLKVGLYVPGLSRVKKLDRMFNHVQAFVIFKILQKHFLKTKLVLLNFKFDFFEIYKYNIFAAKYLFINDDFINMNPFETQRSRDTKWKNQLSVISCCDRVFVSSDPLGEEIRSLKKPITVIYSGHDFDPAENRKSNLSKKNINICFMGFIHDKLEFAWIEMLARTAGVEIVLIGPIECDNVKKRLSKYKNILFNKPLMGIALQNYMSQFDVYIMPYTNDPVNNKSSVPAKLFQYLACGKPIVSSPLDNLIALPEGFVYFARDADEFVEQVFNAKNEDTPDLRALRINFAMKNSWQNRARQMGMIIESDIDLR